MELFTVAVRSKRQRPPLFAEAEPGDDFAIPVDVAIVEVTEQTAPLAHKHQKSTPCVEIMLVRLQVRRQVLNPFRKDRDLDFWGARIGGVNAILPDQCGLLLVGQQPDSSVFLCLTYEHQPTYHIAMANGNFRDSRPVLILLSGLPGSGKTTFARALAARLPLRHIESDRIRRQISPRPSYSTLESGLVFARVEAEVRDALKAGCLALQDATNLTNRDRRRFVRAAAEADARLIAIRLVAPEATIRERLSVPREGNSQAGLAVYEQMRRRPELVPAPVIVVDTRFPLEPALDLVTTLATAQDL